MTAVTDTLRNGVDTEKMFATLDLIKAQPELARFQFRATNRWIDGAHNRSTIKGFYAAGGEDTSRSAEFHADAGEAILLGDTGPNPAEYLLHALAACLTTSIVYVAAARKVKLTSVESTLTGDMDVRGALGVDDEPRNGFERIDVSFRVAGDAPEEKLREVVERARKRGGLRHGHQRRARRAERDDRLARASPWPSNSKPIRTPAPGSWRSPKSSPATWPATRTSTTATAATFEAIDALKAAGYFAAPFRSSSVASASTPPTTSSSRRAASPAAMPPSRSESTCTWWRCSTWSAAVRSRSRSGGASRAGVHRLARADRSRRRRARRRRQRARPGSHTPRHARHPHRVWLADRWAQAVLHDVPRRHRPVRQRHVRRR